jgi:hypothetical protein
MRNGQLDLANQDPFHTGHFLFPVLWIRIHIDFGQLNPDPDPYWECRSGSRREKMTNRIVYVCAGFFSFKG